MAMLKDELHILKAVAIRVDDSHVMLATVQYHTEKTDEGKYNKSKSFYRWFAKVLADKDWEAKFDYMLDDAHRLDKYKIPNDTTGLYLCCKNSTTNYDVGDWLQAKVSRALSWEDGMKRLAGFKTKTANRAEGYNTNAAYDTVGYKAENGDLVDITDKDSLLKHVGQNLIKPLLMGKKSSPTA